MPPPLEGPDEAPLGLGKNLIICKIYKK